MSRVYRSILPENLHFDKDLNLKLAHFAVAVDLDEGPVPCASACVVDYLAPEVLTIVTITTIKKILTIILIITVSFILFSTWHFAVWSQL